MEIMETQMTGSSAIASVSARLTAENYHQGFVVDEDLMAGVTEDPQQPGTFVAFVLQHSTGEYLGYQAFTDLNAALEVINQIPRPWVFEKVGGCGGCGGEGGCSKGGCAQGSCAKGSCGKGQQK